MTHRTIILSLLLLIISVSSPAQCPLTNTAIQPKELITYNLYFNWQFVWVKVGTATMTTINTVYHGHDAFRTSLITRGNGSADKFFVLRDTLTAYCTSDLVPLTYRKGAKEGNYYTVDEATYSYPDGKCKVDLHRQKNDGSHVRESKTLSSCVYDMLNIFQKARSFDPTGWQKGHEVTFDIADGVKLLNAILRYQGKETVKGDNGVKYPCLKLSYIEMKNGKEKQIAVFYVTDDKYHIPVRIDLVLKFGSAKAYLTSATTNAK